MDKAVEILQKYISDAADSAILYRKSSTFSKRWWISKLSELKTSMCRFRRIWKDDRNNEFLIEDFYKARNEYFREIRKAKRENWSKWLSQAARNDIWQVYKYMKPRRFEKLLLIESREGSKTDFEGKCDAFIEAIYSKLSEVLGEYLSPSLNHNLNPREET